MTTYTPTGPPRFSHQIAALKRVVETRGVTALLMDPGTGKTAVALDYASCLALAGDAPVRVLVIAPPVALDTWVEQAGVFVHSSLDLTADVLTGSVARRAEALGSVERPPARKHAARLTRPATDHPRGGSVTIRVLATSSLSTRHKVTASKTTADLIVDAVKKWSPHLIVWDESHAIKGHSSNASRLAARLTPLCPRRLILTGTVMPHSPMDVFGQWRFLAPEVFGTSFGRFRARYATMGGYMGKQVMGFRNLDDMRRLMGQHAIVVKKEDALDLPPVTDVVVPVHLSAAEEKTYADMKDQLVARLDDGSLLTAPNRLSQMMKLRQITSGHLIDSASGTVTVTGSAKVKAAADLVTTTLAGESRVVAFAHFRHEVAMLADHLTKAGETVLVITGDTDPDTRLAYRKRFGDTETTERLVLVCQQRTMSLAVNELVSASHGLFLSLSERRDDWEQARARLDRQGQKRPVTLYSLLVPGTVDEVIHKAHKDRASLEAAMIDHLRGKQ